MGINNIEFIWIARAGLLSAIAISCWLAWCIWSSETGIDDEEKK